MPRSLPVDPSVRFLQLAAKDIIKAHRSGDVACCATLRYHFRFSRADDNEILKAQVTLQEAQHALSIDYGYKDWKELKAHVESVASEQRSSLEDVSTSDIKAWLYGSPMCW